MVDPSWCSGGAPEVCGINPLPSSASTVHSLWCRFFAGHRRSREVAFRL